MGNSESRFREAVRQGDHAKAEFIFYNKKLLRDNVDPKQPCYQDGGSILHYAARHAMMPLYGHFLENGQVSPLIQDNYGQNCLHLVCSKGSDPDLRYEMLDLTLKNTFVSGALTRSVSTADHYGNTPLHYACQFGLQKCVQLLVDSKADLSVTNTDGKTPVDLAIDHNHEAIAKKLETRIVFAPIQEEESGLVIEMDPAPVASPQDHVAMKNQELMSLKDELLIQTSELLGVSLFIAEALLRNYEWSKERLLNAWIADPSDVCEKAGVDLPEVLTLDNIDDTIPSKGGGGGASNEIDCSICYCPIDELVEIQCEHSFCKDCWQQYLHDKIKSGQVHKISCPEYGCYKLIPIHIIEKLVSRDMASKYLLFDIKAFVDSNPNIRWCPHPGCSEAIKKPTPFIEELVLEDTREGDKPSGMMVHCSFDHYFCWDCGKDAHEICTCEMWKGWLLRIDQMQVKIGSMTCEDFGEAASSRWISSNSKPCPRCKTPIEKIDGCNHMKCGHCKHDFCWMCLDLWSKHNSSTGGYYDCNRLKIIEKANDMLRDREKESDDYEKIAHFQHYHSRYKNHCHSLKLELGYLQAAGEKMQALEAAALEEGSSVGDVSFVKDAVRTLVEARQTLAASYGYGSTLLVVPVRDKFEGKQGMFEEQVESLAEVVARPHLRKPRSEIIRLTRTVYNNRLAFIRFVQKDLHAPPPKAPTLPPTSEYMRKRREMVWRERERIRERQRERREEIEEESRREAEEKRQLDEAIRISQQDYATQRKEDKLIQEALLASKQEFDEESQLKSDTEFAIMLSMKSGESNSSAGKFQDGTNDLSIVESGGDRFPFSSASQNSQPSDPFAINNLDLEHWRQTILHESQWAPSSSSSSEAPTPSRDHLAVSPNRTNNGSNNINTQTFFNEEEMDEELATAIALSLSTVGEINN